MAKIGDVYETAWVYREPETAESIRQKIQETLDRQARDMGVTFGDVEFEDGTQTMGLMLLQSRVIARTTIVAIDQERFAHEKV